MYAIAQVIYGIPLNSNNYFEDNRQSADLDLALENADPGFLRYYSGGADVPPSAFGIELSSFDEACHHVDLSSLVLEPTDAQHSEFAHLLEALEPALREEVLSYGEPRVFFLWSTS
jgi:hypothetical protein